MPTAAMSAVFCLPWTRFRSSCSSPMVASSCNKDATTTLILRANRSAKDAASYSVPRIDANPMDVSKSLGILVPGIWYRRLSRLRHSGPKWELKKTADSGFHLARVA